jgi:hypothetical protein
MNMQHDDVSDTKLRGKRVKATAMLVGAQPYKLFRETTEGLLTASG